MYLFLPKKWCITMFLQKLNVWAKSGSSVLTLNVVNNQIAVFFDHQYLWRESIDILYFLHGDNH